SLARPYGGKWADRIGGSKVTLYTFVAMTAAAVVVAVSSTMGDHAGHPEGGVLVAMIVGFTALFVISGIGNGAVTKIIPSVFEAKSRSLDGDSASRAAWARNTSGALIGFVGAIGALGGVGINLMLRTSYASTKSATTAFWVFMTFYVLCGVVCWAVFMRRPSLRALSTEAADTDVVVEAEALVLEAESGSAAIDSASTTASSTPSARA
ncbi:MFS transporter, partial [Nocardia tengchongensis]